MATARPINHDVKLLIGRVLSLYECLSRGDAACCYRLIDPVIRASVNRDAYDRSIAALHLRHGSLLIDQVDVRIMRGEHAVLYKNREFAIVEVRWEDRHDANFSHKGPWVKDGKSWYTRCVGYAPFHENVELPDVTEIRR